MKYIDNNKYAIKVSTQNKSTSFIFFENDNLDIYQIEKKYKEMKEKYNNCISKGIKPTIKNDRNNYLLIRNIEIITTNNLFE
jgi:predicted patatin/cPLA2 family phospholipase